MDIRNATEDDLEPLGRMIGQAYNKPSDGIVDGLSRVDFAEQHLLVDGAEIVAVVRAAPVGQFFGGRSVATADIRNVVVAAHARGRGHLKTLLKHALEVTRAAGIPMSSLTPSAATAYRRAGYEYAGSLVRYQAPVVDAPARHDGGLQPWSDDDLPAVEACYRRFVQQHNGPLDRPTSWWHQHVLAPVGGAPQYRYLLRREGEVSGYVVFGQTPVPGGLGYSYSLDFRDLVWTDEESLRTILSFVNGSRALARTFSWTGPAHEPMTLLFPEPVVERTLTNQWMLRLLDPAAAIAARGYPTSVAGQLTVTVHDGYLEPSVQTLHVRFGDGTALVESVPGEAAAGTTDVGTLASIFSGWLAPGQAAALGRLRGLGVDDLAVLTSAFAGPDPWAMDLV